MKTSEERLGVIEEKLGALEDRVDSIDKKLELFLRRDHDQIVRNATTLRILMWGGGPVLLAVFGAVIALAVEALK